MRGDKYRKLPRSLRVVPPKQGAKRQRPMSRSVARVHPDVQRYSYQMALRRLALKMRIMSRRLRRLETQLARGYRTLFGTKEEMENSENVGGGLLWWATDERVLYIHDDTGWQLSKATQSGTTTERQAYSPIFTGEVWWDTTLEQIFIWDGSVWDDVAVAHSGTTTDREAYSQDIGDLWLDTTEREWYCDIGDEWQSMNPSLLDSISRLPAISELGVPGLVWWGKRSYEPGPSYTVSYINATPYRTIAGYPMGWVTDDVGMAMAVYTWVKPGNSGWNSYVYWFYGSDFSFALQQYGTKFAFGITTDGIKANWLHAETPNISSAGSRWHFLAGIYDPGVSIRLFHNGAWYEYGGTVPSSRWIGENQTGQGGTSSRAITVGSTVVPSNEIVERVYYTTKGLFA